MSREGEKARDDLPRFDMVNHPPHYTAGEIECIDAIKAALGPDGFLSYLRGQVLKYAWRGGRKADVVEDLKKARWYLDREIAERTGGAA